MSTAITNQSNLYDLICNSKDKITPFLKCYDINTEKFIRAFILAIQKNTKLQTCTPESILTSLIRCSELGLEPNHGKIYLMPFNGICQAVVGYKGWLSMLWRCSRIKNVLSYVVRECDEFDVTLGDHISVHHKPKFNTDSPLIATYAIAILDNEQIQLEIADKITIEKSKSFSQSSKGQDSPWVKHYEEMARIVPLRRLAKHLAFIGDSDDNATHNEQNTIQQEC